MSFGKTVNLGNSIIGVSVLAMPYCFAQSGLFLSVILIVLSGFLTRLSCHLLLKSAFLSRRRSFELMVQDVLGSTGRVLVELGLIGFLLGTCVAYFIMIGDIAPKILTELFDIKYDHDLRVITVVLLSTLIALPLSLLKKVDSLTSLSILSMILYSCLILKLIFETNDKVKLDKLSEEKLNKISYWNISGLLTTFPIFSMAMSCQTSLFEIFDGSGTNSDLDTIKRDNGIIKNAIYMCSFIYILVGLLGYMAFHEQTLYGNILLAFPPSITTTMTKFGFIVSLLLSFPLCLFPCRTSVYSLTIGKMRKTANFQALSTASVSTFVGFSEDNYGNHSESKEVNCDNDKNNNDNNYHHQHKCNSHDSDQGNEMIESQFDSSKSNNKMARTNHMRLNPIINSVHSSYTYTKLLNDEDDELLQENGTQPNTSDAKIPQTVNQSARLYMSDSHFKLLTIALILVTIILSLIFPHIEFILGIIGSTAGTTVCFVLPAYTFIMIGEYSKTELYLARLLLSIGLAMLIFCTYSTIHNASLTNNDVPSG